MITRVGEVAWVLAYLDDLDADFARYYRCDWQNLSGPRFFSRAYRVSAYGGIMSAVVGAQSAPAGSDLDSTDLDALSRHAGLSGLIEIG